MNWKPWILKCLMTGKGSSIVWNIQLIMLPLISLELDHGSPLVHMVRTSHKICFLARRTQSKVVQESVPVITAADQRLCTGRTVRGHTGSGADYIPGKETLLRRYSSANVFVTFGIMSSKWASAQRHWTSRRICWRYCWTCPRRPVIALL